MNMVDFQEKMDSTHRSYLCRMLNVKELPGRLLKRYAQVKKLVDRIDGHLTPGDLAMIIISVSFTFQEETTEGEDARLQAEADALAAEPPTTEASALDEADDKVIEEAVESPTEVPPMTDVQLDEAVASGAMPVFTPPVEPPVEPPVSGATGQSAEKPTEGIPMLWSPGMPVKVLIEDELKQGKIFAVHPGDGKNPVQLTVEFEGGENVMVNENEVEAI